MKRMKRVAKKKSKTKSRGEILAGVIFWISRTFLILKAENMPSPSVEEKRRNSNRKNLEKALSSFILADI